MMDTRRAFYEWRAQTAEKEGVELYRVLPSATIEAILSRMPGTLEELQEVKGIKEGKANKYGEQILAILVQKNSVQGLTSDNTEVNPRQEGDTLTYSVGAFLDVLNHDIGKYEARVVGEVGKKVTAQGNYVYFSLRDKTGSVMDALATTIVTTLAGFSLEEGMEIAVTGRANIWKPSGRLSFRAETIELVGEGALRRVYEELRKKLEAEGLFSSLRKRTIPDFPERIGLLTSLSGAVIHDFQTNLGRYGFRIECVDVRVEGARAVPEILAGLRTLAKRDLDVLVVIRGGGSFESLQAFNHESVVRALADFPHPVVAGIGHDKDVPLVCLVADTAPSTPTACAVLLNQSWGEAHATLALSWPNITEAFSVHLTQAKEESRRALTLFEHFAKRADTILKESEQLFGESLQHLTRAVEGMRGHFREVMGRLLEAYRTAMLRAGEGLLAEERSLAQADPRVLLERGYSIVRARGKIIRRRGDVKEGEEIATELLDGTISSIVTRTDL